MGIEDRLRRLEQSVGDEAGPPLQEYHEARERRARYTKALLASALGHEVSEDDLDFAEHYWDSALKEGDGRLIERHPTPRSPEDAARVRTRIKESLDAIAERRRSIGV